MLTARPQLSGKTPAHKSHGFTLVEVLIAMVVLSTALIALISASTEGIGTVGTLKRRTLANIVASNKLTELQLTRAWPKKSSTTDKVEMAGDRWILTIETKPTVAEEFKDRVVQATVSVALEDKPSERIDFLSGFLVRDVAPARAGSAANGQPENEQPDGANGTGENGNGRAQL